MTRFSFIARILLSVYNLLEYVMNLSLLDSRQLVKIFFSRKYSLMFHVNCLLNA